MENIEALTQLSPPVVLPFAIKYFISALTQAFNIPARLLPLIGFSIGASVYPFLASATQVSYNVHYHDIWNTLIGGMLGFAASGVHSVVKLPEPKQKDEAKIDPPAAGV